MQYVGRLASVLVPIIVGFRYKLASSFSETPPDAFDSGLLFIGVSLTMLLWMGCLLHTLRNSRKALLYLWSFVVAGAPIVSIFGLIWLCRLATEVVLGLAHVLAQSHPSWAVTINAAAANYALFNQWADSMFDYALNRTIGACSLM